MHDLIMGILHAGALISTAAIVCLGQAGDIVEKGKSLGNLSASEVLGIVSVACVAALVLLYRDARKDAAQYKKEAKEDNKKLQSIIEANTAAFQTNAEAIRTTNGVMVEVKDAILKCRKGEGEI